VISYAERRRRADALGKRVRGLGVESRRHLVAAFEGQQRELLLVYNRSDELRARGPSLRAMSVSELPHAELGDYQNPFLGFSALRVLRSELTSKSPYFFGLAKSVFGESYDAPELLATRHQLAEWLAKQREEACFWLDESLRRELEVEVRRLLLANLLSAEDVRGLLAVIPGGELSECDLDATLVYRRGFKLPRGTFSAVNIDTVEALGELDLPAGVEPFLSPTLAPFWPRLSGFQPLRQLLLEAGRWQKWADEAGGLKKWLEEQGGQQHRAMAELGREVEELPKTVALQLHRSRECSGSPTSLEYAERAYFTFGLGSRARWTQRGPERIQGTISRHLLRTLEGIRSSSDVLDIFYEALQCWYSISKRDQAIEQNLGRIRELIERFLHRGEGPPLERARAERLKLVVDRILRLARRGLEPTQRDELAKLLTRGQKEALAYWLPAPTPEAEGPLDFTLRALVRHLLMIARIEAEIRDVEVAGGEAEVRSDKLRRLARRIREYPGFTECLLHERPILGYVCDEIAGLAERKAERLAGRPVVMLGAHTSSVVFEQESTVTLTLENRGTVPARLVVLQLQHAADFGLIDSPSVWYWEHLGPLKEVDVRFPIVARRAKTVELVLEVTYSEGEVSPSVESDERRSPESFREPFVVQLEVRPPVTSDRAPATRPVYPAGPHLDRPEQFHGRRKELHQIASHLASDSSQGFLIRSPRRTGKSSLLRMLELVLRESKTRRYFDVPESWDPVLDRRLPVFVSAQASEGAEQIDREFFRLLLQELEGVVGHEPGVLTGCYPNLAGSNPAAAFAELVDLAFERLDGGHRIVFLIDEFDALHEIGLAGFYAAFRAVVDNDPRLIWILASASGLKDAKSQYGSPIFNLFTPIDIRTLSREEVRDLVCKPACEVDFLDEAIDEIYLQARGNAYFTNVLCNAVMEVLYATSTSQVRRITVIEASQDLVRRRDHDSFAWVWDDADDLARALLLLLAAAGEPRSTDELCDALRQREGFPSADRDTIADRLEILRLQGILRPEGGKWAFSVYMVKTWLRVGVLDEDPASWFAHRESRT